MTGLKYARELIEENPRGEAATVLADLVICLESETPFLLNRLYALKLQVGVATTDPWHVLVSRH